MKKALKEGKAVVGSWVTLSSPSVSEIMARAGFDWLAIDTEHGVMDTEVAQAHIQAMSATDTIALIRVAGNDPVLIKRALDTGACGVVVPLVGSGKEAEAAVRAAKYPPKGIRGIGIARAQGYGEEFREYLLSANEEVMVVVQIESLEAVNCISEIVAIPGIDVLFIGPADLSGSLGYLGEWQHPRVLEAIERVFTQAQKAKIPVGLHVSSVQEVRDRIEQGFQFLALNVDILFLGNSCREAMAQLRSSGGRLANTKNK